MKSAVDLCAENGIRMRSYGHGKHYTLCPSCSATRKKQNRKKKCLGVIVDDVGIQWICFNCGNSGYAFYEMNHAYKSRTSSVRNAGPRSGNCAQVGCKISQRTIPVRLHEGRRIAVPEGKNARQTLLDRAESRKIAVLGPGRGARIAVTSKRIPGHHGGRV